MGPGSPQGSEWKGRSDCRLPADAELAGLDFSLRSSSRTPSSPGNPRAGGDAGGERDADLFSRHRLPAHEVMVEPLRRLVARSSCTRWIRSIRRSSPANFA